MIYPQTQVVIPTKEDWMLAVTDQYLIDLGVKKNKEQIDNGAKHPVHPNYYLNKRISYLRYIQYKKDLKEEAQRQLYFPRTDNFWMKFFLPIPKSWSDKKKRQLCFEPHLNKKDLDNYCKAILDSLYPKDQIVWDFRASKFWYDGPGHIEIEIGTLPPATGYTKFVKEDTLK